MALTLYAAPVDTTALAAEVAATKALAEAADAKAVNARGMVLARDPRLAAVETAAASLPQTLAQADEQHAALRAEFAQALAAVSLTPGPRGVDGLPGAKGADGAKGDKGATGDPGPAGTTNLAIAARPVPLLALGGNTTIVLPWSKTMPATYDVQFAHTSVATLGQVAYTNIVKTPTQVSVRVTATVAIVAGSIVAIGW